MNWQDYIHSDDKILVGKPVIKGTRISVEFLIELMASGWSRQQILDNYPRLTNDAVTAVFLYVLECMRDGLLFAPNIINKNQAA